MATHLRYLIPISALCVLVLTGCGGQAQSSHSGAGSNSGTDTASGTITCASYADSTEPALELFTTTAIAKGPKQGQVYGDGTEFSVTLSDEAITAGLLPQLELYIINEDALPELISSLAFDPTTGGDGTFSTSTLEFGNDEYVGEAIVAQVFAISDTPIADVKQSGDKLLLGNYCITYANDGS